MPNNPAPPVAICFDLDDTLINDAGASSAGLRAVMERLDHPDFGAARSLWDVQTEVSFGAFLRGELSLDQQRRERIRALAVQAGHAELSDHHCDDLYRVYLKAHQSSWQVFADAHAALQALASAGFRLGVVTNGPEQLQHSKLQSMELMGYFHAVVCADTAGAGKPQPRIFEVAAQRMGVDPADCWHVGDQVSADAVGAVASRMRPIIIDRQHRPVPEGLTTIGSLEELVSMVGVVGPAPVGTL